MAKIKQCAACGEFRYDDIDECLSCVAPAHDAYAWHYPRRATLGLGLGGAVGPLGGSLPPPRDEAAIAAASADIARLRTVAPPPLTLADVLRIATEAAHAVNPHIAVCVDNMTRAGGRQWLVWLSLAGKRAGAVLLEKCPPDEASETLRATALLVCLDIGRAYRPGAR